MKRRAFLLGFFAIGGQVLLLRELVASLNGDELFISTALFGWLLAVALGAYFGGKPQLRADSARLFAVGAVLLVLTVIAIRVIPMIIGQLPGEVVTFSTSVLISILAMLPVGFITGWLFPTIAVFETRVRASIVGAYLFEGLGAFVGGLAILFVVGGLLSALETAVAIGAIVSAAGFVFSYRRWWIRVPVLAALVAFLWFIVPLISIVELSLERYRHEPFEIKETFDTPYGRQTLLAREGELVLLTDNTVEAVSPEHSAAENRIIAPLVYRPDARYVLHIGRAEFGVGQIVDSIGRVEIWSVDPRTQLTQTVDRHILPPFTLTRSEGDLFTYTAGLKVRRHDIVILDVGSLDTYKSSRYVTPYAMSRVKSTLARGGVLLIPVAYDTDRFVGPEEEQILSTIHSVIGDNFEYTEIWPGNPTLFFASDSSLFDLPYDTMIARLDSLPYQAQFISDNYLFDRLEGLKRERLYNAAFQPAMPNTVDRPLLPHLQALFRSKANAIDHAVIGEIVKRPYWTIAVPAVFVLFFLITIVTRSIRGRFALFLYFVAGFVSLSLELVSFYVYQSFAGSLYSEMAVLIGAFMLGLALGTFFASRSARGEIAHIGLFILFVITIGFELSYARLPISWALYYHTFFLLVCAAATGILFVGATRQFYGEQSRENRGLGYAYEIAGSSLGSLFTVTVLLPVIGLTWLLIGIAALVALAYLGLLISR
ncbi:MAG: hypothetical protein JSV52_12330 [Candidatus Zixiibacteriota bacterium]|nr:MAG: hypothetical protein JSV52_12330 [candidate division Zixibacteria bacterium]